jgi:DNA-binding NarL/FixJ family response regulator
VRRILLVEDEPDARAALARALERAGYSVRQASSVEECRAALISEADDRPLLPYDAAVLDVVLHDRDRGGLELIADVRAVGLRTAIIIITAFADIDRVKTALNAGASYLLEKPFAAAELIGLIARLIGEGDDISWMVDRALRNAHLTDKELSIARLVLKGLPSAEIARIEGNSDKTIRQHISQIYAKCGVTSRAEFFHFVFPT